MEVRSKSKSNTRGRKPQAAVKAEKQPSTKRQQSANAKINDFFNKTELKASASKKKTQEKEKEKAEVNNIKAQSSKKAGQKDIPFISKASLEKIDNPKYKVSKNLTAEFDNVETTEKVKYGKIMEFDAAARKNKNTSKTKAQEGRRGKLRANLLDSTINVTSGKYAKKENEQKKSKEKENRDANANNKNSKKSKIIELVSQQEIEKNQKTHKKAELPVAAELKAKEEEIANKKASTPAVTPTSNNNTNTQKATKKSSAGRKANKKTDVKAEINNEAFAGKEEEIKMEIENENNAAANPQGEPNANITISKADLTSENKEEVLKVEIGLNEAEKEPNVKESDLSNFPVPAKAEDAKPKKEQKKTSIKQIKACEPKKVKQTPVYDINVESLINVEDLAKKAKFENSDLLLLLIEISINGFKYDLKKSNKSKLFWDDVFQNQLLSGILKQFKSETLRKYWRIISETQQIQTFIDTIKSYTTQINNQNIKILTIINAISDTIKGKLPSFEKYLKNYTELNNYRENFFSNHYPDSQVVLGKKVKRAENEELRNNEQAKKTDLFDMNLEEIKQDLESSNYKSQTPVKETPVKQTPIKETPRKETSRKDLGSEKVFFSTPRKSIPENMFHFNLHDSKYYQKFENSQRLKKIITISETDKNLFGVIDEILNVFSQHFKNYSLEQIFDCLKKNSFHLENSFLQLSNPKDFEGLEFSDIDDYILFNMKNSEFYNQLIELKGKEMVDLRKQFLNIEENNLLLSSSKK